jgi:predicted NUDIX family phosphoesterase
MSHTEKIFCIKSEKLFEKSKWNGLKTSDLDYYLSLIIKNGEFRARDTLENDPEYKQIIAQVVLKHDNKYFLHKQVDRTEGRLNGLCPLPLGGHIEEFDNSDESSIVETALLRELYEEVELNANIIDKRFLGLVYLEDGNFVNSVHIGFVYIFEVDSDDIHVKEEGLEDIGFVEKEYLQENQEMLTYWSRIIINDL